MVKRNKKRATSLAFLALILSLFLSVSHAEEDQLGKKAELEYKALPGYSPMRYNPKGRRDPFKPAIREAQKKGASSLPLTSLQRYALSELKLVGIIWGLPKPKVIVEDKEGLGYIVGVGTPIGREGKITQILKDRIVIDEGKGKKTYLRLEVTEKGERP